MNEKLQGNVQKIHEATMRILKRTGVKFLHPDALEVLKSNNIELKDNVAYFTEEQIMHWVGKAPSTFEWHAHEVKNSVVVGGDLSLNAPSAGPPFISDQMGNMRDATIQDYVNFVKLFEVNDAFKVNGSDLVVPCDTPFDATTLLLFYAAYTHSDKCLVTYTGEYKELELLMQIGIAIAGSKEKFMAKPNMLSIVNVNTPLMLDKKMTETLFTYSKYKQPLVIASAAMAGTSSPMTLAGTIALQNAEVLATIVLVQMFSPGTPVLFGSATTTADMRNGSIAIGAPEGALCYNYCAEFARFYGVPSRAGGALTDAKIVNGQAGYESMLNIMACKQGKVNLILQSAGVLNSYSSVSYEKLIMDFEIIDMVERYVRNIEVNEDTIPEDLIDEMGHNGEYILADHTLDYCRVEPFIPNISVRGYVSNSKDQFELNIEKRKEQLYNLYTKPVRDSAILGQIEEIIMRTGVSKDTLKSIENM